MSFASDAFGSADSTALDSHNAAWVRNTKWSSSMPILYAGRVRGNSVNPAAVYYNTSPPSADYDVSADLYIAGASTAYNAGVMARLSSSAQTGYMARYRRGTGVQLFKYVASSTAVQLGSTYSTTIDLGNTAALKLRCEGSTITVYLDGVSVISVTDTGITNPGYAGMWISSNSSSDGVHADNFLAEAIAGGVSIAPHARHYSALMRA